MPTPRPTVILSLVLALTLFGLACTSASASMKVPKKDQRCAATKRVVNGGKPLPWATNLFSVLKKKKYIAPVLPSTLRIACGRGPDGSEEVPGKLDFHRAWKVRDPADPHGRWWRIIPGESAIGFSVGGAFFFATRRCVFEAQRFPTGFTGFPSPSGPMRFFGLVTDDVTAVESSGGTGTKKDPDGVPWPTTVRVKPRHNLFNLNAGNGATQLTYLRGDKPPIVEPFFASPPIPSCAGAERRSLTESVSP